MSPPFAFVMAEQAVREFFARWCAGLQPCLLLETQTNGDIFVSSRVILPLQSEKVDLPHPHRQPQPRHQSPARLRRRARRAQARATAEDAANTAVPKKLEAAVQADKTVYTTDAAIQAVVQASNVAVQADASPPQPSDAPAEQEGRHHSPLDHAVQHHQVYPPPVAQADHARPHQVRDEFCLDDYYKLLQEQSRSKVKQMRDLSEKRSFGFKQSSAKKPF